MRKFCLFVGLITARAEIPWKSWNKRTAGKPVFILFTNEDLEMKCDLCRKIEETWFPMMEDWEEKKHAIVDVVDCSGDGKQICTKMDLHGKLPNMRYGWGGPDALKTGGLKGYSGGRFEDQLKKWAKDNLVEGLVPGEEFGSVMQKSDKNSFGAGGAAEGMGITKEELERIQRTASASMSAEEYKAFMDKSSGPSGAGQSATKPPESKKARRRRKKKSEL